MARKIKPHVTVSCVIFGFDFEDINVLLLEREIFDIHTQKIISRNRKLPGNLVRDNEDLDTSAKRLIRELSGQEDVFMQQFHTFCSLPEAGVDEETVRLLETVGKTPRKWLITVAYYAIMRFDSLKNNKTIVQNVKWVPLNDAINLAFDQQEILNKALDFMRQQFRNQPLAFELLPDKFTLTQLQNVFEIIYGTTLDKRNFRKKTATMKYLINLDEKQKGVAHKPARYFRFDKDIYCVTQKSEFNFSK